MKKIMVLLLSILLSSVALAQPVTKPARQAATPHCTPPQQPLGNKCVCPPREQVQGHC